MKPKLHIPAPGEKHEDPLALYDGLFVGLVLCFVLAAGLGFMLYRNLNGMEAGDHSAGEHHAAAGHRTEDGGGARAGASAEAARWQATFADLTPERLRAFEWQTESLAAAIEHGPRTAAEAACAHLVPTLEAGAELERPVQLGLLQALSRRAAHAPWSCLSRLFFDGRLAAYPPLEAELEGVWSAIERFEDYSPIAASVVADFRTRRERPEASAEGSARFYRWLRLCGLNLTERVASVECYRLLRQLAPQHGEDFLMVADRVLSDETATPPGAPEFTLVADALALLAARGQPLGWRIDETATMPDYDVDFRLGAVFMLCRMVHSPDGTVADIAARRLSQVARVGIRAGDRNLVFRWRIGCQSAFTSRSELPPELYDEPFPLLTVGDEGAEGDEASSGQAEADESGASDDAPAGAVARYGLKDAIERGACELHEGRPPWYCGAERWRGDPRKLEESLHSYFTQSRYVEWSDGR